MGSNNPTNPGFSHCSMRFWPVPHHDRQDGQPPEKPCSRNDACTPNEAKFSLSWMGLHGYTHINQHDNGRKPSMKMYVLLKNHHFPASHASGAGKAHPLLSEEKSWENPHESTTIRHDRSTCWNSWRPIMAFSCFRLSPQCVVVRKVCAASTLEDKPKLLAPYTNGFEKKCPCWKSHLDFF